MLLKVFLAASAGTLLGAYAEPHITPKLPAQMQGPTAGKIIHVSIAGAAATLIFYVIKGKVA